MITLTDSMLETYNYADDPVLRQDLHDKDHADKAAIEQYGKGINAFGTQLTAHQKRVAEDGAAFLQFLGYSKTASQNFKYAMLYHDIGKTDARYDPAIWSLKDRPTPDQKAQQRKHAALGADMLERSASDALAEHPHYAVRYAVTRYHHERADCAGPEKIDVLSLPVFVQVACIVDAYDGDRIKRPHQEKRRTNTEALRRMAGIDDPKQKYNGAFDKKLLDKYIEMKEKQETEQKAKKDI